MTDPTFVFSVPIGPDHTDRLPLTLESLRAQSASVKVALCNAGDKDPCLSIISSYRDIVTYDRHGPDNGQSDAINEGWQAIDGDFYSWLNADDHLVPNALEAVASAFANNPDIDVIYGQSLILDENSQIIGLHPATGPDIELITRSNIISQPSCFYRKRLLDELGLLERDLHYTMDWELWIRFYKANKTFLYLPEVFSSVLWEKGTKTSSLNHRRMREIYKLTRQTHGPYVAGKTYIGFALHYLTEYSGISGLAGRMLGHVSGGKFMPDPKWHLNPENGHQVSIPIYHFSNTERPSISIEFINPVNCNIKIGSESATVYNSTQTKMRIDLGKGDVAILEVSGSEFHSNQIALVSLSK